jgi:hypothetical protein
MPIVSRWQLSSFYGAVEAGEYLYEPRRSEIVFDVAERYLEFAEKTTIEQFCYMARTIGELEPDQLKVLKDKITLPSFRSIMRYVTRLNKNLPTRGLGKRYINDIAAAYNDLWMLYRGSGVFLDEPGAMTTKLIAKGFSELRKACKRRDVGSAISTVDFINGLAHSEGTLIMWIDEDCDSNKRFAAYTLTLMSASAYQPESLQYMYRDIRAALRRKAIMYNGVCNLYDRKAFLRNFKERLELLEEFTASRAFDEIDSPTLVEELRRKYKHLRAW